jgi:3-oxoacyl-[acyl-carrier protein] reductase
MGMSFLMSVRFVNFFLYFQPKNILMRFFIFLIVFTCSLKFSAQYQVGHTTITFNDPARTGGFGGTTSYAASKGGMVSLSKSFARFGAVHNIRANSISPGFLDNPMMLDGLTSDQIAEFIGKTALKRLASDYEIAQVCLFLLGSDASYITGENIEVSAGQVLG